MPAIASPDFPGWVIESGYLRRLEPGETLPDDPPSSYVPTPSYVSVLSLVFGVAIDDLGPSEAQVDRIRAELRKAPAHILRQWQERGGRCEITPGRMSANRRYPRAGLMRATDGWASRSTGLIVVAEQARQGTVLHELGHCFDFVNRLALTFEWRKIFDATCFNSTFEQYYRADSEELFAEGFSMYYFSPATRARLPTAMRQYIERCVT